MFEDLNRTQRDLKDDEHPIHFFQEIFKSMMCFIMFVIFLIFFLSLSLCLLPMSQMRLSHV